LPLSCVRLLHNKHRSMKEFLGMKNKTYGKPNIISMEKNENHILMMNLMLPKK